MSWLVSSQIELETVLTNNVLIMNNIRELINMSFKL